jgi:hypothetical protein
MGGGPGGCCEAADGLHATHVRIDSKAPCARMTPMAFGGPDEGRTREPGHARGWIKSRHAPKVSV